MVLPLLESLWKGHHPGLPRPRCHGRHRSGPQAAGAV